MSKETLLYGLRCFVVFTIISIVTSYALFGGTTGFRVFVAICIAFVFVANIIKGKLYKRSEKRAAEIVKANSLQPESIYIRGSVMTYRHTFVFFTQDYLVLTQKNSNKVRKIGYGDISQVFSGGVLGTILIRLNNGEKIHVKVNMILSNDEVWSNFSDNRRLQGGAVATTAGLTGALGASSAGLAGAGGALTAGAMAKAGYQKAHDFANEFEIRHITVNKNDRHFKRSQNWKFGLATLLGFIYWVFINVIMVALVFE